jgi:hypothetical protein
MFNEDSKKSTYGKYLQTKYVQEWQIQSWICTFTNPAIPRLYLWYPHIKIFANYQYINENKVLQIFLDVFYIVPFFTEIRTEPDILIVFVYI